MSKFDLKEIKSVKGKQKFYQLTVDDKPKLDGKESEDEINAKKYGVLDGYEAGLESKYKKDMTKIYAYMQQVSDLQSLAKEKFREVQGRPKGDLVKEYEFKSGDLRVYCFKTEGGKIIHLGGYKNAQDADIVAMRKIKNVYLESLKNVK